MMLYHRIRQIITTLLLLTFSTTDSIARSQQVSIIGVDDKEIRQNVTQALSLKSRLEGLKKGEGIPDYEWLQLQRIAPEEAKNALKPYGYYEPYITVVEDSEKSIKLIVDLGPAIIIEQVDLELSGLINTETQIAEWYKSYPLKEGERLVQPDYDEALAELSARLRRLGYLDAKYTKRSIELDRQRKSAHIQVSVDAGQKYAYGNIEIDWLDQGEGSSYSDQFLSRYISINNGDSYDGRALQKVQSKLVNSGYFSTSEVRPLFGQASDNKIPVKILLEAPKQYAYGGSLGFGTDTGLRTGASVENRRVNPSGHRASLNASVSDIRSTAITTYSIPQKDDPRSGMRLFASFEDDSSDTRNSETISLGIDLSRSLSANSQASFGISYQNESFIDSDVRNESQILLPKLSWQIINTDNLQNPKTGYSLVSVIQGASDELGSDLSFLQVNLNAKGVYQFGKNRLLGRVSIGQTLIEDNAVLPTSFRYFAGGDFSVRGYAFESIGMEIAENELKGGENLVTASIEYEREVWRELSIAMFVDAGDAYDDQFDLNVGVGVGARWRLPFGAIRLDVAQGLDLEDKPFRLHFTFGADL